MKTIPERKVRMYMSAFIAAFRSTGRPAMKLNSEAFSRLRSRSDFLPVLGLIESRGLATITWANSGEPYILRLTNAGVSYLEDTRDTTRERRWTRGLAIAAIVISLAALVLELDDRGYLGGMLSCFKSTQSAAQSSSAR